MYIYLQWLKISKNPIKVWYIDLVKCEVFSEQLLMSKYTSNPCYMEKDAPQLINPFTPNFLLVILLTVFYTVLIMPVWRIWYHIKL